MWGFMNKRAIQFLATVFALCGGVSAQAEPPPVSAGLLEHILSGRAVPGSYGGVEDTPAIFTFPKGRYFITSVFCSITGNIPKSSARIYIGSADRNVRAPFHYINAVIHKSDSSGTSYVQAEPNVPLYLDNISGKMVVRIEGLDDGYPVCQLSYLAYKY